MNFSVAAGDRSLPEIHPFDKDGLLPLGHPPAAMGEAKPTRLIKLMPSYLGPPAFFLQRNYRSIYPKLRCSFNLIVNTPI
jgi:hypothetical protein